MPKYHFKLGDAKWRQIKEDLRMRVFVVPHLMLVQAELSPGWDDAHSHPYSQIGMVLSGRVTHTIGDQTEILGPGDVYCIPPDVPHGARVSEEDEPVVLISCFYPPREDYARDAEADLRAYT